MDDQITDSPSQQHKENASKSGPIDIALVTVSDSRTPQTDENAHYLKEQIEAAQLHLADYVIVKDDPREIEDILKNLVNTQARIIIFNGGTGISKRDRTFDVVSRHLQKSLPGFGELFRMLSYQEIGSSAMLSRALAGVYQDKLIISIPGSPHAVKLAWEKLIAPELQHLAWEILR